MGAIERAELRGRVLEDKYRLGAIIGVGGTGVVFEARRLADNARVVVKVMRPVFAHNADLVRRLRREAEVARRIAHPGIVPVHDEGWLDDGTPYIVMKRMYGESLNRILMHEGALPADEVAAIAMRVSGILHVVHAAGYVHRDIKPEHVLLERNRHGELEVSLLDFGVCAAETAPADERERERGRVFGTPTYVSPEQAAGIPEVDGRADVFGLGIVMFECLAGRVPFTASNVSALLRRIIREDAPRVMLCAPGVDIAMDAVVSRALARSPHDRFGSARALMRALAPHAGERAATEARLASRLRGRGADHVETASGDVVAA